MPNQYFLEKIFWTKRKVPYMRHNPHLPALAKNRRHKPNREMPKALAAAFFAPQNSRSPKRAQTRNQAPPLPLKKRNASFSVGKRKRDRQKPAAYCLLFQQAPKALAAAFFAPQNSRSPKRAQTRNQAPPLPLKKRNASFSVGKRKRDRQKPAAYCLLFQQAPKALAAGNFTLR